MAHPFHWILAGSTGYLAVSEGRVIGILYWEDALPTENEHGEPEVLDAGWCWVPADDPEHHHYLTEAPLFGRGMEYEDVVRVHDGAREAAAREIGAYHGL